MCFVKKLVLPFFLSPYLFCFFFSLPFGFLKAQYYPVQGTLQVKRSYSLYLNDYALPSREVLVVSLTNRDIQTPRYKSASACASRTAPAWCKHATSTTLAPSASR